LCQVTKEYAFLGGKRRGRKEGREILERIKGE